MSSFAPHYLSQLHTTASLAASPKPLRKASIWERKIEPKSPEDIPEIEALDLNEFLSESFDILDLNLSHKEGWDGN